MALDGFFINKLVIEVKNEIEMSRLEKISQVDKDIFVFSLYLKGKRNYLWIKLNSPNASFFITNSITNNEMRSHFLDILKFNLNKMILSSIKQVKNDRVIIFEFTGTDLLKGRITKKLVLELMGRYNNLILIEDDYIIDAYHKQFNENRRSILPKNKFEFFPNDKKDLVNINYDLVITNNYLSKNYVGVSPLLSNYLFENRVDLFNIEINPTLNLDNNKFYWFDLFEDTNNKKHFNTLSNLLEHLVSSKQINNKREITFINNYLVKLETRYQRIISSLEIANDNLNYKNLGDAIYSSGLNLSKKYSEITVNNETIKLNSLKTLNENAQNFYKSYQKAKRTILHLNEQKEEINNLINLFNQYLFDLENNDNIIEIANELKQFGFKIKNKKNKPNNNILKLEIDNNTFYIGKNNLQNEYITHQLASKNDYWFHVENAPGSHVILKGELNDELLLLGAKLAAYFSKLKNAGNVNVNYTKVKNIKKIPKIPGYQVIIKNYQSIMVNLDDDFINNIIVAYKLK